jgi:hypothetical protein
MENKMTTTTTIGTIPNTIITRSAKVNNRTHSLRLTYSFNYRVVVSTTHDSTRKCYRTTLSLVQVESRNNGIEIEKSIGSIFDKLFVNTIDTIPCNRFSETSFATATETGISLYFNKYETQYLNEIAKQIGGVIVTENYYAN